jgi:hypothetical protein
VFEVAILALTLLPRANLSAGQSPAALPSADAPFAVLTDDILEACAPLVRRHHAYLVEQGVATAQAMADVMAAARRAADFDRDDAARSWEALFDMAPNDPPSVASVRCMARRRLEQIDRKVPAESRAVETLKAVLAERLATDGRPLASAPARLVSVPLARATHDMIAEDLIRACAAQAVAKYVELVSAGEPVLDGTLTGPDGWQWSMLLSARMAADVTRAQAIGHRDAFTVKTGDTANLAWLRCLHARRAAQFGVPLRVASR